MSATPQVNWPQQLSTVYGVGSLTQQTAALSIADVAGKTRETRLNEEGQARRMPYLTYNNLIG